MINNKLATLDTDSVRHPDLAKVVRDSWEDLESLRTGNLGTDEMGRINQAHSNIVRAVEVDTARRIASARNGERPT